MRVANACRTLVDGLEDWHMESWVGPPVGDRRRGPRPCETVCGIRVAAATPRRRANDIPRGATNVCRRCFPWWPPRIDG